MQLEKDVKHLKSQKLTCNINFLFCNIVRCRRKKSTTTTTTSTTVKMIPLSWRRDVAPGVNPILMPISFFFGTTPSSNSTTTVKPYTNSTTLSMITILNSTMTPSTVTTSKLAVNITTLPKGILTPIAPIISFSPFNGPSLNLTLNSTVTSKPLIRQI